MGRIKLAQASEIADSQLKIIEVGEDQIGLFKKNGKFYAYLDVCTHTELAMGEDALSVEGDEIVCPYHGASFECTTGKVLNPPAEGDLTMFDVVEVEGELFIDIA